MYPELEGKTVLVTGATRGIGFAIAAAFAQAKANLIVLGRSGVEAAAQAIRDQSGDTGVCVTQLECDISDSTAVKAAMGALSHIDILVNNAGLERITPLDDMSDETEQVFRTIVETNILGTYFVTKAAVPKIPRGGRIILTGSIWSKTAVAEFSAYCSTKHANLGLMRSWAKELAPRGISVNAVCPGWVKTDAAMLSLNKMATRMQQSEDALLAEITGAQAFDGLMVPEDVAAPYLFLASNAADNITGQALNVDRGEVMV